MSAKKQYKYTGVLPFSINVKTKEIYFLLGQEAKVPGWSESEKWSDFGGSPKDEYEDPLISASREFYEESMGIFGCESTIRNKLVSVGKPIHLTSSNAVIYLLPIDYDEELPKYYNNIYNYLTKCAKDHPKWKGFQYIPSCPEGYYEKIAMKWITKSELINVVADPQLGLNYRKSFLPSINEIIINDFELFFNCFFAIF